MASRSHRPFLFAFTLLMAGVWTVPPPETQASQSADDQARKKLQEADRRALDLMRKEIERPGARTFDVKSRTELLGKDPARIVAFVQKEIRFEPYPGVQRGPAGVLVAGAGNALDKAFLLRELLRAAGIEARMTRATMAREKAASLVQAALKAIRDLAPGRFSGPYGIGPSNPATYDDLCRQIGVAPEEMRRLSRLQEEAMSGSWKDIGEVSSREQAFLRDRVAAAKLEAPERPVLEELTACSQAHARVQWRTKGDEKWSDADPCLADAESLKGVVPGEGEVDPRTLADRFVLTLALERRTGQNRETVEVLKYEVPVFDTLLEPPQLSIQPTDPKIPEPGVKLTKEDVYKLLTGYREFAAVVTVADRAAASMVFDYDGVVSKPTITAGKIGRGAAGAAGQAADLFGPKKDAAKSSLERLWVDLSATREGKALWRQSRSILNPGEQATWCPMLQWDLFLQTHEVSRDFVRYMGMTHRLGNVALVQGIEDWARAGAKGDPKPVLQTKGFTYPVDLLGFALARQAYAQTRSSGRTWLHFDRPNLFISGRWARLHGAPDRFCLCYAMDLVENGALEVDAAAGRIDREATSALGVFDTVLEQAMVGGRNATEGAFGAVPFFERARSLNRPIRFVSSRDGKGLIEAGVPKVDAEWILANAEEGTQVMVASMESAPGAGSHAWWSYDPRTGRTVGRVSGGRGGAEVLKDDLAETAFIIKWTGRIMCLIVVLIELAFGKKAEAANTVMECAAVDQAAAALHSKIYVAMGMEVGHIIVDFFQLQHAGH